MPEFNDRRLSFSNRSGRKYKGMDGTRALVAHHEGQDVGYIRYDPAQSLVEMIEVYPEYQRRGVGTALAQEFKRRKRGAKNWERTPATVQGDQFSKALGVKMPMAYGFGGKDRFDA